MRRLLIGCGFRAGILVTALVPFATSAQGQASFQILQSISLADGNNPGNPPIISGSTLYGTTSSGDNSVFGIGTDGTGFNIIHQFTPGTAAPSHPSGSLLQLGSTLFGATAYGGNTSYFGGGSGVLYSVNTDGTGYNLLHVFNQDTNGANGSFPVGSLVQSGSLIYGMTSGGGPGANDDIFGSGTIFRMNTDGSDFIVIHSFTYGNANDGGLPVGDNSLLPSGSSLFGMSVQGGASNTGALFKLATDGTGFTVLHSFNGGSSDGSEPYGGLIQSGSTLYGTTKLGGSSNLGTIFAINVDGTGFQILHSFGGSDGSDPSGSLLLSGAHLYGLAYSGGTASLGTLFQLNLDGSDYSVLHSFVGGTSDGANPPGALVQSGSVLFGTTMAGGSTNHGTIFSLDTAPVPEPGGLALLAIGTLALAVAAWRNKGHRGPLRSEGSGPSQTPLGHASALPRARAPR